MPTTLSAGEFSAIAGVTDERRKVKELFRHPRIIPRAVILDPAITVHTPEWLFLSTGIRAVDHCVEGICSGEAHPYADAQALRGLSLLCARPAAGKGRSVGSAGPPRLPDRSWLSMGPLASGVPMGASHGIGYVLGAVFDIPHGHTSCIMLPAVMRWNKPVTPSGRRWLRRRWAIRARMPAMCSTPLSPVWACRAVWRRSSSGRQSFDRIAEQAMGTPWVPRNPRRIDGPAQVREILELAA